ncbi:MAG: hypothetical protein QNJ62_00405 [Methyloceanibacter sp.]|nr:hypothetical protein [Methyloceanibacter sp.]
MKPFTRDEHDVIGEAITRAEQKTSGKILAEHFPPKKLGEDELPNHLIVLDAKVYA